MTTTERERIRREAFEEAARWLEERAERVGHGRDELSSAEATVQGALFAAAAEFRRRAQEGA